MKSRLTDVTLKVIAVLGWDNSLGITQITLQRKSSFTFQVEQQWQMADLGAGHGFHKVWHGRQAWENHIRPHLFSVNEGSSFKFYCFIAVALICQVYVFSILLAKTLLTFCLFSKLIFEIYTRWCCVIFWAANWKLQQTKAASLWFQFW